MLVGLDLAPFGDIVVMFCQGLRECVPADAIRALIEPEKPQAGN